MIHEELTGVLQAGSGYRFKALVNRYRGEGMASFVYTRQGKLKDTIGPPQVRHSWADEAVTAVEMHTQNTQAPFVYIHTHVSVRSVAVSILTVD